MKPLPAWCGIVVTFLLAAGAGYWVDRFSLTGHIAPGPGGGGSFVVERKPAADLKVVDQDEDAAIEDQSVKVDPALDSAISFAGLKKLFEPGDPEGSSIRLRRALANASEVDLRRVCDEIDTSGPIAHGWLWGAIAVRWCEVDPEAAVARLVEWSGKARADLLTHAAYHLAHRNFEAAQEWWKRLENPKQRRVLWRMLVAGTSAASPAEDYDRLNSVLAQFGTAEEKAAGRQEFIHDFARKWAQKDGAALKQWGDSLARQRGFRPETEELRQIVSWGTRFAEISSKASSTTTTTSSSSEPLPPPAPPRSPDDLSDLPQRLAAFERREPDANRLPVCEAIMTDWSRVDPSAAAAWLETQPDDVRSSGASALVKEWANHDPRAAANWLAAHEWARPHDDGPLAVGRALAQIDGAAAFTFSRHLDSKSQWEVVSLAALKWARTDPAASTAASLEQPTVELRRIGILAVAETQVNQRPTEALAWVWNLPDEVQVPAAEKILRELVRHDPAAAAAGYGDLVAAGRPLDAGLGVHITGSWSRGAPAAAAAWAESLPEGPARINTFGSIADTWSSFDFFAASQWVSSLPDGPEKESCTRILELP